MATVFLDNAGTWTGALARSGVSPHEDVEMRWDYVYRRIPQDPVNVILVAVLVQPNKAKIIFRTIKVRDGPRIAVCRVVRLYFDAIGRGIVSPSKART